jgi:hypothetical protein
VEKTFDLWLPAMLAKHVPDSLNYAPLSDVVLSKRDWSVAFDEHLGYQVTFADKSSSEVCSGPR